MRIASVKSPWLSNFSVGDIETLPISHGEGRFVIEPVLLEKLAHNGQIATQYVDIEGNPSGLTAFNPNGSTMAIEGILSPDGRIFGRMGHCERKAAGLYKNIDVKSDISIFDGAVEYYK